MSTKGVVTITRRTWNRDEYRQKAVEHEANKLIKERPSARISSLFLMQNSHVPPSWTKKRPGGPRLQT